MYQYKCKIIKIIDGDTVDIDLDLGFNIILANQRVRLANIDTPESRTSNKEEKVRGMLSKKKLASLLPIGSRQVIETEKPNSNDDKFGRILGTFILKDGTNVNQWMIDNNYGAFYEGQNKKLIEEQHQFNKQKLIERGEL